MSNFDPNIFLDATITAPTEKRPPLPIGEYTAVIGEISATSGTSIDKKTGQDKVWASWIVPLNLDVPPALQAELKLPATLKITDRVFLDLNEAATGLDMSPGKNTGVRRYREALDMNKPGDSFSPRSMTGRLIRVAIGHDLYNGEIQERVKGVSRA